MKYRIRIVRKASGGSIYFPQYRIIPFIWDGTEINGSKGFETYAQAMDSIERFHALETKPKDTVEIIKVKI